MRPIDARRSIGEIAAEHIREAILDNVYSRGERLIDSRIAAELGTSRGSIREALKLLQTQGLVVQKAHRGTFVISPSAEDIRDTCELRVALETHAVRLLALRPKVDFLRCVPWSTEWMPRQHPKRTRSFPNAIESSTTICVA